MKLYCFILGLVLVICTIWESGLAQIVCNDPGGFILISDNNGGGRTIYTAPIPGSTSSTDKVDLTVTTVSDFTSIAFHQATSTLFWAEKGVAGGPPTTTPPQLYREPINECYTTGPVMFLDGSVKTDSMDVTITAMTIDETNHRLYWAERYVAGTPFETTHAIWTVSLNSDDPNGAKTKLYDDPDVGNDPTVEIVDLEFDLNTQQLYWVLNTGSPRRAAADGSGVIISRPPDSTVDSMGVVGIELDITNGNIYLQHKTSCEIHQLDINLSYVSQTPLYSDVSCTAIDFFLSAVSAAEGFYTLTNNHALIQIPLSGGSDSKTDIVNDLNLDTPINMIFVPNCPIQATQISFTASKYTTCEGTNITVEILRSPPCYDPVVARVLHYGGSASASRPSDYGAKSGDSEGIKFPNLQSFTSVSFEIYADDRTEGNETFIVELADPSQYAHVSLGEPYKAEVTIIDKSSYIQFAESAYEVREGDPTLMTITLERIGNLENSASVSLVATPGTAMEGDDYDPNIADVTFNAFESKATAVISITDDDILEMDETFQISIFEPQSQGQSSTEVLIKDDEIGFTFQQDGNEFNEDIGEVIIPVERVGSTELEGSVNIAFRDSNEDHTAMVGEDFTHFNPTTLTFAPGQSVVNIYVFITNDNEYESTESFQISISDPQPEGSDIIIATTTVSILDDEENIRFAKNQATAREGETTILRLQLIRDVALKETSVLITSCEAYRSAVGGQDFVPINSAVVRFILGNTTAYTPDVIILNDNIGEVYESFRLVITSPEQGAIACNEDMTNDIYIGIIDDDGATHRFSSSNYVIPEYSANLKVRINQEGILSDDDQQRVTLSAISGSAINNQDFVFNGPRRLNFGDTGYTDVLIQIVSDNEYEQGGETFTLQLTNDDGDILDTASVTIQDDDRPPIPPQPQSYYFREDSITVVESKGEIRVVVLRTERSIPATILIDTVTGSATPGDDYFPLNRYPVEFSAGDLIAEKVIYIVNDEDGEDTETFQVVLSSPTDGGSITGGPLTVTITDDDESIDNALSTAVLIGIIAGILGALIVLAVLMCVCYIAFISNGRRTACAVPPVQYNSRYGQPITY
ncbi:extracellular matrix organizing protein FRAS1-like [Amphiura filiformis]|uniref:extracellular matrix organizing protein FRAS1-like n=1 Tax=Amphiura filiformis TaxID=82378 RepID=UPI003B228DBC